MGGRCFQALEKETLSGLWKGPFRALFEVNASAKQISLLSGHQHSSVGAMSLLPLFSVKLRAFEMVRLWNGRIKLGHLRILKLELSVK